MTGFGPLMLFVAKSVGAMAPSGSRLYPTPVPEPAQSDDSLRAKKPVEAQNEIDPHAAMGA